MGYLLQVLLAIAAQAAVEGGFDADISAPWAWPLLAVAPYALAGRARRAALAGRFRSASRITRWLALSPPLLHLVALAGLGWFREVEGRFGAGASLFAWPTPAFFLVLLPFLVFTYAAIDAQARLALGSRETTRLRRFQLRMFASSLAPIALYVLVCSLAGASRIVRAHVEYVGLWGAAYSAALLALFALILPWVLRGTWDTVPLPPGGARAILEGVAAHARFRCRELLVWRTGGLMANAAIVGLTPRDRVVLFSDSLLAQLSPRQLAAVFGHEIGHARRRHVPIFLAWSVGFLLSADLLAEKIDPEGGWVGLAIVAATLGLWALGFGWLSRRFELEADLESVAITGDPAALIEALDAVGGHLRDVAGWRHFSVAERAAFLTANERDPRVGRALRRRLGRLAIAGLVVCLAAIGLEGVRLKGDLPRERVVLALALGDYPAAAQRLARLERSGAEGDAELARLVAAGEAFVRRRGPGRPAPGELTEAAREALAFGDPARAADLLRLAELAGDRDAARIREVLVDLERADRRRGEGELDVDPERLPAAWRPLLLGGRGDQ